MTTPSDKINIYEPQADPLKNLSAPFSTRYLKKDETDYLAKVGTERAMHWLYRHHIVYDLLPEKERVAHVASKPDLKVKALGNLTYLENEPEKENLAVLTPLFTIFTILAGLGFFDLLPAFWLLLVFFVSSLIALVLINVKNSRIKRVAAWANSWRTAIQEHNESGTCHQKETGDLLP